MKRCFDVLASTAALIMLAPIYLACGFLVKADSPGPALFRHERIGRDGRPFEVWKFRSMVADGDGRQITTGNDRRITRSGRFLRRYKLDELPQLFNVLRGQMSIVGPRPEVRRYVDVHSESYREILSVRPGLTDPASIRFRHEETLLASSDDPERTYLDEVLPAKVALSLEYVRTKSFTGDLALIVQTLAAVAR